MVERLVVAGVQTGFCYWFCCCCCSAYLSSCRWTASDANLLEDPHTFHCIDYFVIGGIRTCLRVSSDPMLLWIFSKSCRRNLLLACWKPPSRDNHRKVSYPRTQQIDQGAGWTQIMRSGQSQKRLGRKKEKKVVVKTAYPLGHAANLIFRVVLNFTCFFSLRRFAVVMLFWHEVSVGVGVEFRSGYGMVWNGTKI